MTPPSDNGTEPATPNFTAWFVLQALVAAAHRPDFSGAISPRTLTVYEALALEASKGRIISKLIYRLPYRWQYSIMEMVTTRGRPRHFVLRKQAFEAQARTSLSSEAIEQVVVLGAGLDVLSLQLAKEYPHVAFTEIDVASSQRFKTHALQAHHVAIPPNVEHVSGDLSAPLAEIMQRSRLCQPGKVTLWLAEGLFMFIPEQGIQKLLTEIRNFSRAGSVIAFTTIPERYQGVAFAQALQRLVLRREASDFAWAIAFDAVPDYVKKLGWSITGQISYQALHKGHIEQNSDLIGKIGEDIHMARM